MIPTLIIGKARARIRAPYHPRLAPELKREIPKEFRDWDPNAKLWRFSVKYVEQAKRAMYRCWTHVAVDDGQTYRILDREGRETQQGSLL